MKDPNYTRLQIIVFILVTTSFTNIYLTQPILPVLKEEFAVDLVQVSFTMSAVILGIALANLPFGALSDRLPIHPIILVGGIMVAIGGFISAAADSLWMLIGARFLQGLFIPALTTCLAAYLAKTLPIDRLKVVMGSYVSATVLGGMGGRLIAGWIHPPLHWRYAFVTASILVIVATFMALMWLPRSQAKVVQDNPPSFLTLLKNWGLVRIYLCAAGSFFIFTSIFNYLPFRLSSPPFNYATEEITLLYLVYIIGIFMGPLAGRISNHYDSGSTLIGSTILLSISLVLILIPSIIAVIIGLLILSVGFFTIHATAVGALNHKISKGQGRANALYVLFYYIGAGVGITTTGYVYKYGGWSAMIYLCLCFVVIPFYTGMSELKNKNVMQENDVKI